MTLHEISSQSVDNVSNVADRQTDRQAAKQKDRQIKKQTLSKTYFP